MKAEDLFESIGAVDEDLLARSEQNKKAAKASRRRLWYTLAGVAAAAIIFGVVLLVKGGIFRDDKKKEPAPDNVKITTGSAIVYDESVKKYAVETASYPILPEEPDGESFTGPDGMMDVDAYTKAQEEWIEAIRPYREKIQKYGEEKAIAPVNSFAVKTLAQLLANRNGQNCTYSPINIYMTLAMLAEITDGSTREQVLSLLESSDIADLRTRYGALWNHLYHYDKNKLCVLGASVWLRDDRDDYNKDTLKRLAQEYFATSFRGEMGSDAYNKALRNWINAQTGKFLRDQVDSASLDPDTVLALVSTIWYTAKWHDTFDEELTDTGMFHGSNGDTLTEYMHETQGGNTYYTGDNFVAVPKYFESDVGAAMWFILPNEGSTVDDLLADPQMAQLLTDPASLDYHPASIIHFTVPKFDIASTTDLASMLANLGVTEAFDPAKANFTPVGEGNYYLTSAEHTARVKIDENGVEAAAYTIITCGAMLPEDEITFTLDRPFLFVIRTYTGVPLFIGVVEQPQDVSES